MRRIWPRVALVSFLAGVGMELFMIKVSINGVNFYEVAKRKRAEKIVEEESNSNK